MQDFRVIEMDMSDIEWKTSHNLMEYAAAQSYMEQRVEQIINNKAAQHIWFLEHPPLYTAGTSAKPQDLVDAKRFPVYETGRGGQFTYHGPGQRVAYIMLDLKQKSSFCDGDGALPDIRQFVTFLENWMIACLKKMGLHARTYKERVGVWVDDQHGKESKIGAIGIRVRRHVSFHGFALNVSPDLGHFSGIIPCGIHDYGVTSLKALGVDVTLEEIDALLKQSFWEQYNITRA